MTRIEGVEHQGRMYMRLTSVLGCFRFPDDYDGSDLKKMKEGGRIGDQVHQRVVKKVMGKKVVEPKGFEARMAWRNWLDWDRENAGWDHAAVIEQRYFHPCGVSFQVDAHDQRVVRDWKTSQRLMCRHWLQVNSEAGMLRDMGWPISMVQLVRLSKVTQLYEAVEQEFDESLYQWFLGLVRLVDGVYNR